MNIDSKDRPDYSELKLLFNSAQEKITEISEQLDTLKGENSQLRGDIKTLIEFKNELESLAEDQDKQIQNLNDVFLLFYKFRRVRDLQNNSRTKMKQYSFLILKAKPRAMRFENSTKTSNISWKNALQ